MGMSKFLVLGDSSVHELLVNLSKDEIISFQKELGKSLQEFSVDEERLYQLSSSFINRPNGQRTLFRPFTSQSSVGTKIIVEPAPIPSQTADGSRNLHRPQIHGIPALCDENGLPTGVINAEEVTGYRTSLCALIPYLWRRNTEHIVVFGAGKQALWHLRLALALRGSEIRLITVVNRSEIRAKSLIDKLEEENELRWKSPCAMESLDSTRDDYEKRIETLLSASDVVFCTVPSQQPLFPLRYVTRIGRDRKQPYISAIGSWQPDTLELDPEILRHAVEIPGGYSPESGAVIVDDCAPGIVKRGGGHSKRLESGTNDRSRKNTGLQRPEQRGFRGDSDISTD
ncbi:Fc.00g046050.m01.CDS01 [Cosmosporella sp. VM-42]